MSNKGLVKENRSKRSKQRMAIAKLCLFLSESRYVASKSFTDYGYGVDRKSTLKALKKLRIKPNTFGVRKAAAKLLSQLLNKQKM